MNKPNTKCRVCGKEYFCCLDSKKINSWRTMACSIECFQEYMSRIEKSRKHTQEGTNIISTEYCTPEKPKGRKKRSVDSETNVENDIVKD